MFRPQPAELGSQEASFCSPGTHRDKRDKESNPIKRRFLPTSPLLVFFFLSSKKTEEKRFAHLVVTNGDMKCEAAPDKFILLSVNLSLPAMELATATITAFYLRVNQRHLLPASIW